MYVFLILVSYLHVTNQFWFCVEHYNEKLSVEIILQKQFVFVRRLRKLAVWDTVNPSFRLVGLWGRPKLH
jgi:hypothetical protein